MKNQRQKALSKLRGRVKSFVEGCDPATLVKIAEKFHIPVPPPLLEYLDQPDEKQG